MKKQFTVTFLPQNLVLQVEEGTTLLQAEQMAGLGAGRSLRRQRYLWKVQSEYH